MIKALLHAEEAGTYTVRITELDTGAREPERLINLRVADFLSVHHHQERGMPKCPPMEQTDVGWLCPVHPNYARMEIEIFFGGERLPFPDDERLTFPNETTHDIRQLSHDVAT